MRAIICDVCGKTLRDTPRNEEIRTIIFTVGGFEGIHLNEKELCVKCEAKMWKVLEPANTITMQTAILEKQVPRTEVPPAEYFMHEQTKETLTEKDAGERIDDFIRKISKKVGGKVIHNNTDGHHLNFAETEVKDAETILCRHCHKPFIPKTPKSTLCSKYCSNHAWIDKQKLKNETPEQRLIRTDALLEKLKHENMIIEVERPTIYHD